MSNLNFAGSYRPRPCCTGLEGVLLSFCYLLTNGRHLFVIFIFVLLIMLSPLCLLYENDAMWR